MSKNLYVAYYRVSTEAQGKTGLGLADQQESVLKYINENGELLGELKDIESGKSEQREGMLKAIQLCKMTNATLVVKDLSRISRGGYKFREMLDNSKINFIECTSPHDPTLVKDIKFSLAKDEREKIASRTKAALQQIRQKIDNGEEHYSKTGNKVTRLGNPENLSHEGRKKSIYTRKRRARNNPNNVRATALIVKLRTEGMTYDKIAENLNNNGFDTAKGNLFSPNQVRRLWNRYCLEN